MFSGHWAGWHTRMPAYDDAGRRPRGRLVDRGVDEAQVVDDATSGDQALAGLPHLVVDDVDPVVVIGGQLAPRVAVQEGGGPIRTASSAERTWSASASASE